MMSLNSTNRYHDDIHFSPESSSSDSSPLVNFHQIVDPARRAFLKLIDEIKLDGYPFDCTIVQTYNKLYEACETFFTFFQQHEDFFRNGISIDYEIHVLNATSTEPTYLSCERFLENFFAEMKKFLKKLPSHDRFDNIKHMMAQLHLFQRFLTCYSKDGFDDPIWISDLINLLRHREGSPICHFKNVWKLMVSKGITLSGELLRSYLSAFFDSYTHLKDFVFTYPGGILTILKASTPEGDGAFQELVKILIDKLPHNFVPDFLKTYVSHIPANYVSKSRHRYLFAELTEWMKLSNYESLPLDSVLCELFLFELINLYEDPKILKNFLQLTHPAPESKSINSQHGRYIVEVVLLVIKKILKEEYKKDYFRRLMELMKNTHVEYVLAFLFTSDDNSEYLNEEEINNLANLIRDIYPSKHQPALEEFKGLIDNGRQLTNSMNLLHSWVHHHISEFRERVHHKPRKEEANTTLKSDWPLLFVNILEHIKRSGFHYSAENDLVFASTTDFKGALFKLYESFANLRGQINPDGFRVEGADDFYNLVLRELSMNVKSIPSNKDLNDVLAHIEGQVNSLHFAFTKIHSRDMVDLCIYSEVEANDIEIIMNDKLSSDVKIGETDAMSYILDIVKRYAPDCGRRLHLYGQFIRMVKPRFDVGTYVFKLHVETLSNCEDKRFRERDNEEKMTVEQALLTLLYECLETSLKKLAHFGDIAEQYKELLKLLCKYDSIVERRIAKYKYSLQHTWDVCSNKNPGLLGDYNDLDSFRNNLHAAFEGKFPGEIEDFQGNQVIVLYILQKLWESSQRLSPSSHKGVKLFYVGTGQGKTLIEAAAAIQFLQRDRSRKVIILTAFPHLAVRDHSIMQNLYRQFGFNAMILNSEEDAKNFTSSGCHVIYANSQTLVDLILENAASDSQNLDLLRFMMENWNHHLKILDECDVLLKKGENLYARNRLSLYNTTGGDLRDQLKKGLYRKICKFFGSEKAIDNDLNSFVINNTTVMNEANDVVGFTDSLGSQLGNNEFFLPGACFSWKAKLLEEGNVLGFSGTLDSVSSESKYRDYFPESTAFNTFKIPLFFAPEKCHGNVSWRKVCGDSDQFRWLDDAIRDEELPMIENGKKSDALPEDSWVKTIKEDIEMSCSEQQGVIIFAEMDATNSENCDFKKLQREIRPNAVYGNDSNPTDTELQNIAVPGRVTLCCKKVGRGADIRIPPYMTHGLHVIIASPDYKEEVEQQLGRAGRMNNPGTLSLIFRKGASIPNYQNGINENRSVIHLRQIGMEISHDFFTSPRYQPQKRKYFFWFIYLLRRFGMGEKKEKKTKDDLWKFVNKEILERNLD